MLAPSVSVSGSVHLRIPLCNCWHWHPFRVHPHLIMINATQLSGEELLSPQDAAGIEGVLLGGAVVVVLLRVASTTAEPKRHATSSRSLEEANGIQICWPKRHFDLLVGNIRRQHTHTHAHPRIPIYPGICVRLCAACGQPDKKAFSPKARLLFASRSRTTVAHVLPLTHRTTYLGR